MEIILTLDIPEAKTENECRQLMRVFLECGKNYSLIDVKVVDFKIKND